MSISSQALETFSASFERVRGLLHIGKALSGQPMAGLDLTESFRASVVLAVSALDSYIHNLCIESIASSYAGERPRTKAYRDVNIRLAMAEQGLDSPNNSWLIGELKALFARDTFQRPDDVAKALRFVDDRNSKWGRIGASLGLTAEEVKRKLGGIVDRRNMIVHEADLDPIWHTARDLTSEEAEGAVEFIFQLVNSIDIECWKSQ